MEWIRRASAALVALVALGSGMLLPQPAITEPPELPVPGETPYGVCPVARAGGGFEGRVGLVTDSDAVGRYSAVAATDDTRPFSVPAGESLAFSVGDLGEVGFNPVLVESAAESLGRVAAATFDRAGPVAAMARCEPAGAGSVALLGMATNAGEGSTIILANPFAAEATVRLVGSSEFGPDTPSDLEAVRIPAQSTAEIVLDQAMAGREHLGFTLYPETGLVVAGLARSGPDTAVSEAISGGRQWFVSLPGFGVDGWLIVRSLAPGAAEFRIDRVDPSGATEGVDSGQLEPNSQLVFHLEDLGAGEGGFVVNSTEDVAVATAYVGEELRTVSAGTSGLALQWLVPVSAARDEGQSTVWIFNPSDNPTTASIDILGGSGAPEEFEVPAGTTTGLILDLDGRGASISTGEAVAVFHGVLTGTRAAMTPAYPLE